MIKVCEERALYTDREGRQVVGTLARPERETRAVVILCHGFGSGKDSQTNHALTTLLPQRGLATFRFDFFGHGESDGMLDDLTVTAALGNLEAAIALMRARGFVRIGVVGSSFGGLVGLLAGASATQHGEPMQALALKAPTSDWPALWRERLGPAGLAAWQQSGILSYMDGEGAPWTLRYTLYEDAQRHDAYTMAKTITVPVLIVHGGADALVPLHQSQRLFEALQCPKRLEILPVADHRFTRPDDFQAMIRLLADWLVEHLA